MWHPKNLSKWFSSAINNGYFNKYHRICFCIDISNILYHLISIANSGKVDPTKSLFTNSKVRVDTGSLAGIDFYLYVMDAYLTALDGIAYYREWARSVGLEATIVFFAELGESYYHKQLSDEYKSNRNVRVDSLLDEIPYISDKWFDYIKNDPILSKRYNLRDELSPKNYNMLNVLRDVNERRLRRLVLGLLDATLNLLPNTYMILLKNMEADFVPAYLAHYCNDDYIKSDMFVTVSNDSDMFQNISHNHCIIHKTYGIITRKNRTRFLATKYKKLEDYTSSLARFFSIHKSLTGDNDNVKGVYGIGPKRAAKIVYEFASHIKKINDGDQFWDDSLFPSSDDIVEFIIQSLETGSKTYQHFTKKDPDKARDELDTSLRLVDYSIIAKTLREQTFSNTFPSYCKNPITHIDNLLRDNKRKPIQTISEFLEFLHDSISPILRQYYLEQQIQCEILYTPTKILLSNQRRYNRILNHLI